MTDRAFLVQLEGYGLTTAEICYAMPDYPALLQIFAWQEYDAAPDFPVLFDFLDHWRREIDAEIRAVRIAHEGMIRPATWRSADGVISWE
ncbi:protein usg [Erythrobacter sp. HI0063]|jgi:uncharacterized protein Usg|uniref:usg protein n=1 Tax=Erythrobacter sp. HI0063 TaxID=1822240 RepID=UPI0007C27119|nr:usg protein [Erythrobacter sp. HI0063]KZY56297.1 protein usg [Erythrobacter sp. HI0063]